MQSKQSVPEMLHAVIFNCASGFFPMYVSLNDAQRGRDMAIIS